MESDNLRWLFSFVLKILCCQHDEDVKEDDETFEVSLENGRTSTLQISHGHGSEEKNKLNGTGANGRGKEGSCLSSHFSVPPSAKSPTLSPVMVGDSKEKPSFGNETEIWKPPFDPFDDHEIAPLIMREDEDNIDMREDEDKVIFILPHN